VSRPVDPQLAVDFIRDNALALAQAKANRVYLEEFRKSLKATLMKEHDGALGLQEREAYADARYIAHLGGLREAVAAEEELRWKMVAAQARIEVWRSTEASNRVMDRAAA